VQARLERAELPDAAIQAAIEELSRSGYLDDARYARMFAQDRRELDSWGRERIARTLAGRGIERELIDAALEDEPADEARASALLRRRFPSPPEDLRDRERALGMLLRKGYDSEVAYSAVRSWAQTG
jgi:regulatory protein